MWNMLLGNLLILINLYIFSNHILKCKTDNIYIIDGCILFGVIILSSRSYPSLQLYGTFLMMGFYILFVFFLYSGKILTKLFVVIIFVITITFSEVIVANLFNLLFNMQASDLNTFIYAFALISSNVLSFGVLNIIAKWLQLHKQVKLPKFTFLIFILPITTFIFIANISDYFETFRTNAMIAPIIVGLLIANFISIYIFFQTIQSLNLKNEMQSMQMRYDTINSLYQNNFNFLHDTIWKLNEMYKKVKNKEYVDLDVDIEELSDTVLKKFNIINTNSSIVSSILNFRLDDITKNSIQVKTDFIYSNYSFLPIQVQNDLFSMLVNSTIDSCVLTRLSNKFVVLKSEKIHSHVILKCSFTFDCENSVLDNNVINEIHIMVSKYNGNMQVSMEQDNCCEFLIMFTLD